MFSVHSLSRSQILFHSRARFLASDLTFHCNLPNRRLRIALSFFQKISLHSKQNRVSYRNLQLRSANEIDGLAWIISAVSKFVAARLTKWTFDLFVVVIPSKNHCAANKMESVDLRCARTKVCVAWAWQPTDIWGAFSWQHPKLLLRQPNKNLCFTCFVLFQTFRGGGCVVWVVREGINTRLLRSFGLPLSNFFCVNFVSLPLSQFALQQAKWSRSVVVWSCWDYCTRYDCVLVSTTLTSDLPIKWRILRVSAYVGMCGKFTN